MTPRVVILSEIIAPYRIPVFNALARDKRIDLHVVFLSENDPFLREWRINKDELQFSYEVLPNYRRRVAGCNLLLNRGLADTLSKTSPQAIICGGYNYFASWQAVLWARRNNVPFLLWSESNLYDLRRKYPPVEWLKSHFLRRCTGYIVPGSASCDYLRTYELPQQKITRAPNAVDNALFGQAAEEARQQSTKFRGMYGLPGRYFLFVGRLVPEKGVLELLDAYGELAPDLRSEIGLLFVGNGRCQEELVRRASRIQTGVVKFSGFLQRDILPGFYALADMLILPTHSDTWGLVVNEAMACGLPVISTSVAGCSADLVQDGWNGLVVPPRDVGQLAAAMDSLARNAELRRQMGENSARKIAMYSPANCAAGLARAASVSLGAISG
ncbi:MAG TPA: glycosyltransferase family 4 protein [Terriglobales bacterium]|nr:glycosyltransferase family 4 protein [Terriglobales bacterium]